MNKTDAAKLAQAYQWLAEEKEVECLRYGQWWPWDGWVRDVGEFRIKPEPAPLLELWVNRYNKRGAIHTYHTKKEAETATIPLSEPYGPGARIGVHMREVREPDIQAMVSRFMEWELPDDFLPDGGIRFAPVTLPNGEVAFWPTGTNLLDAEQAEQMIRHILGEEK